MSVAERTRTKVPFTVPSLIEAVGGVTIGPDDTVVDVGCGNGSICAYAASLGAAVVGLDVEPSLILEAGKAVRGLPARSWQGIVSECDPIPLPDASATVVICTEVLEHVEDPARLAAELVRIGKPGAVYFISVPDPVSEGFLRHFVPDWYWRPPFHRRIFGRDEFARLLRDAGLTVERREWFGFHYTIHWMLWATLGLGPYDAPEDSPALVSWAHASDEFHRAPSTYGLGPQLDRLLPKSQVYIASKRGGSILRRLRRRLGSPASWKRRLKLGSVRLFGIEASWSLRKARSI